MRRFAQFVIAWEWVWLLALLPVALFLHGWISLVLLLLPLLWGVRWVATRRFKPVTAYDTAVLLLAITVLISLYAVFDIALSFPKIIGVVFGIFLFYGAVAVTRQVKHGVWYLTAFFLLAGIGMAFVGLIGVSWTGPVAFLNRVKGVLPTAVSRIPGTIGGVINPNEMAGVLNWVAPLLIALTIGLWRTLWAQRRQVWLLALLGMAGFATFMLIATLSRGGVLSLGLSLLIMLAVATRWGRWLLVVAIIAGIGFAFYLDLNTIFSGDLSDSGQELGFSGRLEIWSRAIYGLQDFPFTGMSMNGFRRVVHILYPLFLVSPDTDIVHAHNQLLQVGLDLGIPGLIAYLAIWGVSVALLWQSWHQTNSPVSRALIVGLSGALAGGWFFGMLDAITLGARPGFLWWILLALIVAAWDTAQSADSI
ncbi:MAG: O-antigen ligase family protein [Chloroflexota bacterium]